eukprot:Skav232357  [mRNA]  locus=scaffold2646:529683:532082:+ [translate_table: standard]
MACPRCSLFSGSPCHSCRTYLRIGFLLSGGKLLKTQESAVLAALRSACGALTDLAEEAAPILEAELELSGPSGAKDSTAAGAGGSSGALPAPVEATEEKKPEETEAELKAKTLEEDKPEARSKPGRKDKVKREAKESKREKLKRKERAKKVAKAKEKKKRRSREDSSSEGEKEVQKKVDEEVQQRPSDYGLHPVIRGSAGKRQDHHGEPSSGSARPPEPLVPPHSDSYWGATRRGQRDRSRSRRRGTKGAHHAERGRQRGYWPPGLWTFVVAMPPRAKARGRGALPMAKAGAKAKAKAKAKGRAKAAAKAKAAPRVRLRLRRPAGARGGAPPAVAREASWADGDAVPTHQVALEELGKGTEVVVENGLYYTNECKIAGSIKGVEINDGEVHLKMAVSGTTSEPVLKMQSGQPTMTFRVHRCGAHCNGESVADDLVHARTLRTMKEIPNEEGWVKNLEKIAVADPVDELRDLRAAGRALEGGAIPSGAEKVEEKEKDKKDKKKEKSKKRKKKEKEKEQEKAKTSKEKKAKEVSASSEDSKEDGRKSKQAAQKTGKMLFGGTGLDPREQVRARVTRHARKLVKKKADTSSKSEGSSSSSEDVAMTEADASIFNQSSKVRLVADGCPGALTCQAIGQMRSALYHDQGMEDSPGELRPTALAYFRQYLQRRTSGPALREMMTLSASLDCLLRNRPACAADILTQRLKSMEAVLNGAHWSVGQRLEVVGQDIQAITGREEIGLAQRDVYQDAKSKYYASFPDGRPKGGGKSSGKSKDPKEEGGKGKRQGKGKGEKPKGNKEGTA